MSLTLTWFDLGLARRGQSSLRTAFAANSPGFLHSGRSAGHWASTLHYNSLCFTFQNLPLLTRVFPFFSLPIFRFLFLLSVFLHFPVGFHFFFISVLFSLYFQVIASSFRVFLNFSSSIFYSTIFLDNFKKFYALPFVLNQHFLPLFFCLAFKLDLCGLGTNSLRNLILEQYSRTNSIFTMATFWQCNIFK